MSCHVCRAPVARMMRGAAGAAFVPVCTNWKCVDTISTQQVGDDIRPADIQEALAAWLEARVAKFSVPQIERIVSELRRIKDPVQTNQTWVFTGEPAASYISTWSPDGSDTSRSSAFLEERMEHPYDWMGAPDAKGWRSKFKLEFTKKQTPKVVYLFGTSSHGRLVGWRLLCLNVHAPRELPPVWLASPIKLELGELEEQFF
jgi:hypothetical protein